MSTTTPSTVNSQIIACIYYCDFQPNIQPKCEINYCNFRKSCIQISVSDFRMHVPIIAIFTAYETIL